VIITCQDQRMRAVLTVSAAAAILLGLASCSVGIPVADPSSSRPHATSATPAPSSEPTRPALADLILSPGGLGPLRLGQPVPSTASDLALATWKADACVDSGIAIGQPYAGQWITTYPDDPAGPLQHDPFRIAVAGGVKSGAITAVQIFSPAVRTATGIHLGSSADDVARAYPGATVVPGSVSTVTVVDGPGGRLLIEVAGPELQPQQVGTVVIMTAIPPEEAPRPFFASDTGVGCPV
jgi:hypothetical protein